MTRLTRVAPATSAVGATAAIVYDRTAGEACSQGRQGHPRGWGVGFSRAQQPTEMMPARWQSNSNRSGTYRGCPGSEGHALVQNPTCHHLDC